MLVKDNLIEFARMALDRAVVHPLPARRIKSLYQKYIEIEEKHGTPERVKAVKKMAAQYVKSVTGSDGRDEGNARQEKTLAQEEDGEDSD